MLPKCSVCDKKLLYVTNGALKQSSKGKAFDDQTMQCIMDCPASHTAIDR